MSRFGRFILVLAVVVCFFGALLALKDRSVSAFVVDAFLCGINAGLVADDWYEAK
jgi:hypothetical protein